MLRRTTWSIVLGISVQFILVKATLAETPGERNLSAMDEIIAVNTSKLQRLYQDRLPGGTTEQMAARYELMREIEANLPRLIAARASLAASLEPVLENDATWERIMSHPRFSAALKTAETRSAKLRDEECVNMLDHFGLLEELNKRAKAADSGNRYWEKSRRIRPASPN